MSDKLLARACLAVVLLSGLLHIALGWDFLRASSATFDEPVHLVSGYGYWAGGWGKLNIHDHPPFAEAWAAFPLVALRPSAMTNHPDYSEGRKFHVADEFLYRNTVPAPRMLAAARAFNLATWSLVILSCVAWWAWRLGGPPAAAWASILFAFTPTLFSNEALATTDAASAALYFAAFCLLSGAIESFRPTRWVLLSSIAAGLAMASKFNMAVLVPLMLLLLAVDSWWRRDRRPDYVPLGAIVVTGSVLTLGAVYRLNLWLYVEGLAATAARLGEGRASFLMGSYSTGGTLEYFPLAFAIKTPLPLLLLGALGLVWVPLGGRSRPSRAWVALPMLAYFAASLGVKVQIGLRHLLPVYPFWIVLAGAAAAAVSRRISGLLLALCLVAFQGWSVWENQPDALAYFNEAVGGPAQGYKYLVDSNLDWGQALPELAELLRARGNPAVYLCYFGTADPAAEGIRFHPVAMSGGFVDRPGNAEPTQSERLWLAVSATHLQSTYYRPKRVFDWLLPRKPAAVAGKAIFLYDLSEDPEGREELARLLDLEGQREESGKLRAWRPRP